MFLLLLLPLLLLPLLLLPLLLSSQSSLEQLSVQKDLLLSKLSEADRNGQKLKQQLLEKEAEVAQKEVSVLQCVCACGCVKLDRQSVPKVHLMYLS